VIAANNMQPMGIAYIQIGDLPDSFLDIVMREFTDYSVALARVINNKTDTFTPLGSGVLVRRKNRFGILSAHHCLHRCTPEVQLGAAGRDKLMLMLRGGRSLLVQPHEAIEHPLGVPHSDEFGPDMTFIEILPGERLNSFKAIGSFWSLDRDINDLKNNFGRQGIAIASIGFPEIDYNTHIHRNNIHHTVNHMAYVGAIREGDISEKSGWDYLESTCDYNDSSKLPFSFAGVSGGPVWGMQLRKHKNDGHFSIEKSALIGITFYQTAKENNTRRLRAHFMDSIYNVAWKNVD
jgi:hypothetical protein